jgi:DNA ligase (NAD+)
MSDAMFDTLVDTLREIDPKNDFLKTVGAPPANSLFKPVPHQIAMGSLEKVKTFEELGKWWDKLPVKEVVVQWKYDGCSLSLEYKKGKLVRAVSRGDGKVEEDVTVNILRSTHIIKQLPTPFTGFIRGECLLYKEDFKKYWPDGSNPRNQGNGAMRSKDGAGCEHLRVLPYDVVGMDTDFTGKEMEEVSGSTEIQKLQFLESCGFMVHLMQKLTKLENVEKAHEAMGQAREKLPFEVDGIVVKLNDCAASEAMGVSDDRPKGQRAYKWEALGAETVLEDVIFTIGHTGAIIPTGKVKPVGIGGVIISNVLLNNVEEIERLGARLGSTVAIIRAGDVVPKCIKAEPTYRCSGCGFVGTETQQKAKHVLQLPSAQVRRVR